MSTEPTIRSELRPGDLGMILAHHGRIYRSEHGVDATFEGHVASTLAQAAVRGFPTPREAIRIVELDREHAGSLALTDEGDGEATIRWFVLSPEVRGRGLGRRLLEALLDKAEEVGYAHVGLETFSELEAAAHLYLDQGFEVVWEDSAPRWGRDRVTYQRYELELPAGVAKLSA